MSPIEQGELLVRIDERLAGVSRKVDEIHEKANNGGWPRCVERDYRLIHLEDTVAEHLGEQKKDRRFVWGVIAALAVKELWIPVHTLFTAVVAPW